MCARVKTVQLGFLRDGLRERREGRRGNLNSQWGSPGDKAGAGMQAAWTWNDTKEGQPVSFRRVGCMGIAKWGRPSDSPVHPAVTRLCCKHQERMHTQYGHSHTMLLLLQLM